MYKKEQVSLQACLCVLICPKSKHKFIKQKSWIKDYCFHDTRKYFMYENILFGLKNTKNIQEVDFDFSFFCNKT